MTEEGSRKRSISFDAGMFKNIRIRYDGTDYEVVKTDDGLELEEE